MRQRIILFLFTLMCIATASWAAARESSPLLWWTAEAADLKAGESIVVSIQVGGADRIYGTSFQLSFDPAAFEVVLNDQVPVSMGAFFEAQPGFALKNQVDAVTGRVEYALTLTQPAQPVSGEGVLAVLTLRALKDTAINLTLENATLVSPQFEEVDGKLVARSIVEIPAQIVSPVLPDQPAAESVAAAPVEPVVPAAPADNSLPDVFSHVDLTQAPANTESVNVPAATSIGTASFASPLTLATVVFFTAGALLLLVSLWMYTRMRHQMRSSSDFEIGV